jgi:3-hydroxybutyryl-CoA dehydrogenase
MGDIRSIGVVGAGQMGAGIAQVAAASGVRVVLRDLHLEVVDRALQGIGRQLEKLVEKGKLTADDRAATLSRIKGTASLADFADVDVVIEAVTENEELKKKILVELDGAMKEGAILATNTSSISITRLAAAAPAARALHRHALHEPGAGDEAGGDDPRPQDQRADPGRDAHARRAPGQDHGALRRSAGLYREPHPGADDQRGRDRLAEGLGTPEDIDTAMKLGTNQPMGPLALADLIGLDTCLSIMEVLHSNLGDPKYRPAPLLRRYVAAGWLGKKAGRGFYRYDTPA